MSKPWFRAKTFGYGAGLPCSWEGWAVLIGFVAAMAGAHALPASLTAPHPWLGPVLQIGLIIALIVLAYFKSDKPWTWRWGGK